MKQEFKELGYKNRFECAIDQFRQYFKERKFFEHYFANAVFAISNRENLFVDYRSGISHKNKIMIHGFGRLYATTIPLNEIRTQEENDLEGRLI